MYVMGINGGMDRIDANETGINEGQSHDSAATLLQDGKIVAAFEEERLNRIKHTNKFPRRAIQACLDVAGIRLGELDHFAVYSAEDTVRQRILLRRVDGQSLAQRLGLHRKADTGPRQLIQSLLERDLNASIDLDRIHFVKHHLAHAESAFALSGFERALVVTIDGQGDNESGLIGIAHEGALEVLKTYSTSDSIGHFYTRGTIYLGFGRFDECKVMGLAPYGDPSVYRHLFQELYVLKPAGEFQFNPRRAALLHGVKPRLAGDPIEQSHKDFAAALQETVENIVLHILKHYRDSTGISDLCLAGGVAHNCTMNGRILESGLFSRMFVQPASHDAGCSLGAALRSNRECGITQKPSSSFNVYLGSDVGSASDIESALSRWLPAISFQRSDRIIEDTARLLADGKVIGWVQGKAEFGPRALGNRSILADPRPAENREIINAMIKKREAFRPFAPAVLAERAADFYDIPVTRADLCHMTYRVAVREPARSLLGAVAHVDGTARLQTVSRELNERFWQLIRCFGDITGVPILLNASFNNNAEPIVDTVDDAVVCFLTTQLHYLIIGDYIIQKPSLSCEHLRHLSIFAPEHVALVCTRKFTVTAEARGQEASELANSFSDRRITISDELLRVMQAADGRLALGELLDRLTIEPSAIFAELQKLWSQRTITLLPVTDAMHAS